MRDFVPEATQASFEPVPRTWSDLVHGRQSFRIERTGYTLTAERGTVTMQLQSGTAASRGRSVPTGQNQAPH